VDDQTAVTMTITVKLFAILRDKAGLSELPLILPEGASVSTAIESLLRQYPDLRPFANRIAFAVNLSRVPASASLHHGDELALLPPVSGG
jgi:molybdopterin converting factor small subunit